ncbi:hypothetical protein H6P81_012560 [Aristolochia fimbriata]|uniref:HMA domain-containing protein n=1 Tax=Aristolochia fimbriata TaxID=158543 RepID=A0AAV7EFF3_ARIFI|nr:hypothetical protein H6P81_012560 [Aristolochia fimbriata]
MAGISAFPSLNSACGRNCLFIRPLRSHYSSNPLTRGLLFRRTGGLPGRRTLKGNTSTEARKVTAVAEETSAPEEENVAQTEQSVAIPVSPSDILTMFFQAEGTMEESAVPAVTQALEGIEGITDLKVQVIEGIASVEMTKQTTIQATGVASNLVEVIQGSGFKLQTLNLSFEDEEDSKN